MRRLWYLGHSEQDVQLFIPRSRAACTNAFIVLVLSWKLRTAPLKNYLPFLSDITFLID